MFLEEVVLPENEEHFKEVADSVAVPLATGISTVPCLKRFLNCQRVYKRSPVANGTATESATSLKCSSFSWTGP
jgi:hypothetical protein